MENIRKTKTSTRSLHGAKFSEADVIMLLDIPVCVAAVILSNWLDVKCAVQLDSSYCRVKDRGQWLSLLQVRGVLFKLVLPHEGVLPSSLKTALDWFAARKVKCDECTLPVLPLSKSAPWPERRTGLTHMLSNARVVELKSCYMVPKEEFASLGLLLNKVELLSADFCQDYANILPLLRETIHSLKIVLGKNVAGNNATLPNLKRLSMFCAELVTGELLRCIISNRDLLTELHISGALHQSALDTIASSFPNLQYLFLSNNNGLLSDESLERIAAGCPDLIGVYLAQAGGVTNRGVKALVTHCQNLRLLRIPCDEVDDATLQLIATHCGPRLLALDVWSSYFITATGMAAIVRECTGLRAFAMDSLGHYVESDIVEALALLLGSCKSLRELDVDSSRFFDYSFSALADAQPNITHFSMHCTVPGDGGHGFVRLLRNCRQLRTLSLYVSSNDLFWRQMACDLLDLAFPQVKRVQMKRLPIWKEHFALL